FLDIIKNYLQILSDNSIVIYIKLLYNIIPILDPVPTNKKHLQPAKREKQELKCFHLFLYLATANIFSVIVIESNWFSVIVINWFSVIVINWFSVIVINRFIVIDSV
ncbi:hypothetical protein ACJX0J_029936, partial [Zea mays]